MNLYLTADKVGTPTGGGVVTFHESLALGDLGEKCVVIDRDKLLESPHPNPRPDPWLFDDCAERLVVPARLAHIYSGTFTDTVKRLKDQGTRVSYTIAAHSIDESRKEFEELHGSYPFPHLTEPLLWQNYSGGYRLADRVIVPSLYSSSVVKEQGICDDPVFIPHGCDHVPEEKISPLPKMFTVGYLGAYGPDKGVRYLLQAWKKLNYSDSLLVLGGRESMSPYVNNLINTFGGGNVHRAGWYSDVADFYNSISLYVQPSVTEGFGIEVLEAMMYRRQVICSFGAGASFLCNNIFSTFDIRDVGRLCECIDYFHRENQALQLAGAFNRKRALNYTWDKVEEMYKTTWKEM